MPAPYSMDLRIRVVEAYLAGDVTYEDVAERFNVGVATVDRWVARQRRQGSVEPDRMGGDRHSKFDAASEAHLTKLVEAQPDIRRDDIVARLSEELDLEVSSSAVQRALERLGLTRKERRSMLPNGTRSE